MIRWKISLVAAVLSGGLTAGALFHFQKTRNREVGALKGENTRLRLQALQRAAQVSAGSEARAAPVTTSAPGSPTGMPPPAVIQGGTTYRNEGNATPRATLQTFAWAGDRGDVALVGRLLYLDPAARTKGEAYWLSLPPGTRAKWKTLDEMAAAVVTDGIMNLPFPAAEILATATEEPAGENRVRLRLPNMPRDGTEYVKTDEGWKYVVTEAMVDGYLGRIRRAAAEKR